MGNQGSSSTPKGSKEQNGAQNGVDSQTSYLSMAHGLAITEVATITAAVKSTLSSDDSSLDSCGSNLIAPLLEPTYPSSTVTALTASLLNFDSLSAAEKVTDVICNLYSSILRPKFSPCPAPSKPKILEIFYNAHRSAPKGDENNDENSNVFNFTFPYFDKKVIANLNDSYCAYEGSDSLEKFLNWVSESFPNLYITLSTYLRIPLLQHAPSPPASSSSLETLLRLSFQFPPTPWSQIFDTDEDGMSFNRFRHAIEGYSKPLLTIITIKSGSGTAQIGAYTDLTIKESAAFQSCNGTCFLFTDSPTFKRYTSLPGSSNHFYLNSASRSKNLDNLPHGVGWGGYVSPNGDSFRVFLKEGDFSTAAGTSGGQGYCASFEAGEVLPSSEGGFSRSCEVYRILVLGVSNIEVGMEGVRKERERKGIAVNKARKVDRAQFLDDFRNGTMESKAFAHVSQVDRGRAGEDAS
ncbi:hypothetical protein TrST_g4227 [Triparma strigata]|uniref:TLDc domain-containing protein n=1 Tax=Triparma strigata TaxID=1606541 RepID=A0A9W6ZIV0_9STRA|nr:hypothetical protein TrST_g4227 [Triparma strigata]